MIEPSQLSKILKDSMKAGKYTIGAKETIAGMKGVKAIICTRSLPARLGAQLKEEAKKHEVPVVDVGITSVELARMIGRPFRVSTLALRSLGDGDLKQLVR
jgi:ribosomal protein L30E